MATSLAQLGVQYMPSNGACMLDMAAAPTNLFDVCSTVHIRVPDNQRQIDVHSGMICIKPSEPIAAQNVDAYREQYVYPDVVSPANLPQASPKQQQGPPSFETPESPAQGPISKPDDGGGEDSSSPGMSSKHGDSPSPTTIQTRVRPVQPSTVTTTCTSSHTPSRDSHFVQSSVPLLATTTSPLSTTIRLALSSSASSEKFSTFITSPLPPSPPPSPTREPPIYIPVTPTSTAAPPPPPPSVPTQGRPAQPSPTPAYCGTTYVSMDVTTIDDLDPHDLDLYLNLLGIVKVGLDLDHGVDGLLDGLLGGAVDDDETRVLHRELEHSYRVRCGVDLSASSEEESSSSSSSEEEEESTFTQGFPGDDRVVTAGSQTACLERCERDAIGRARKSVVADCLGAAWHRSRKHDNCRFWTGGRDEFLPVERLAPGDVGEWDMVYL
ncbi:hypothetical protein GGR54DRAFT_621235 [Hypoxylon sp. NC1633]|nr:hypothetical protein GGR54DRAFT_621235 [Hypoxylon sp. NC1633]